MTKNPPEENVASSPIHGVLDNLENTNVVSPPHGVATNVGAADNAY